MRVGRWTTTRRATYHTRVPTHASRYRPDASPDYSHRFHAGNVGDVWKHCVLVSVLAGATSSGPRVSYLDTHAGEGRYALQTTPASGRKASAGCGGSRTPAAIRPSRAWRSRLAPGGERPHTYPGSPLFARAVLGEGCAAAFVGARKRRRVRTSPRVVHGRCGGAHRVRRWARRSCRRGGRRRNRVGCDRRADRSPGHRSPTGPRCPTCSTPPGDRHAPPSSCGTR